MQAEKREQAQTDVRARDRIEHSVMYYASLSRAQLGLRVHPAGHVRSRGPNVRRDSMRHVAPLIMLSRNIGQTYVHSSAAKLTLL